MQPIIVIGMHRSGSSLLVKILQELGIFMGNDLEENNESMFFNKINDWMLFQAGASWDNPENFKYISDDFKALMVDIVQNRLKSTHLKKYLESTNRSIKDSEFTWGWKDPRNTFTIDIWKEIFPEAKVIHIYRNPVDVIASLANREASKITITGNPTRTGIKKKYLGFRLPQERLFYHSFKSLDKQAAFGMWEKYVKKALKAGEYSEILNISYETLIENPLESYNNISAFCNVEVKNNNPVELFQSIDQSRKYTFIKEKYLVDFYEIIKDNDLVVRLGYRNII